MTPLVSICIPTYNGEAYIAEAMDSAISQTYPNLEIIVSDDQSIDKTMEIIEGFKSKTTIPIHIYKHDPKGIGANWNNCIKHAKGDYIKFLFQDDLLHQDCLSQMMSLADSKTNFSMIFCKRSIIGDTIRAYDRMWFNNFGKIHEKWHALKLEQGFFDGMDFLSDRNLFKHPKNKFGEPTNVLINKTCFERIGYFNTQLKQELDFEFWLRVLPKTKIGFIDRNLVSFRLHDKQASQINFNSKAMRKELKVLYKSILKNLFWHLSYPNKIVLFKKLVLSYSIGERMRLNFISLRHYLKI